MSRALTTRSGLLTSAFYGAIFAGLGAHLPYWPLWLESRGLTEAEIGVWMGLGILVRLVGASLIPALADRLARRRALLATATGLTAALALLHLAAGTDRTALFLLTLLMAFAMAPATPMAEGLGVRAAEWHRFPYAHARAVGSVTFLAMVLGLGWGIGLLGLDAVVWAMALSMAAAGALALWHPGGGAAPGSDDRLRWAEAGRLISAPVFLVFALAAGLAQGSHATYYAYGTIAWRAQGLADATIGALWAFGVAAEILLMLGPGRLWVLRLGPARALALAAGLSVLRWGAMALGPAVWLLWPLQALHAASFGLAHLAAMGFIAAALPGRMAATGQGLSAGLVGGLVFAGATPLAGLLAGQAGHGAAYGLAAAMAAGSGLAALMLARLWQGGPVALGRR